MAIPEKIGKYQISEQIGVGGFGAVYRGKDPFIKRTVAIKTCQLNDEEIKNRFFREAELAGNLHHRNITTIFDFGVENGIPYIVQEFLTGEDLDKVVKRGDKMPVSRKVEILMAIVEGLAYAHRSSIIHRDIKPSNIRILEDGSIKIMDFGIAKSLQTESNLTQTGITLGTSAYLAPEQIRGEQLDQRTDIFALGTLAYELLTYRKPFRGEHLSTVLYKILNEIPEPIESIAPDVPRALADIVRRAVEKDMGKRFPSMDALHDELVNVYREMAGGTSRFLTNPRMTQSPRPEPVPPPIDHDQTIATPSKGMERGHITPPSGALARVPQPTDRLPRAPAAGQAGLELVNFRDPSERTSSERAPEPAPTSVGRRRPLAIGATALGVLAIAAIAILVARDRSPVRPAPALVRRVATAPLVLPTPQLGREPAAREAQATAVRRPTAEPARPTAAPEPARPARKAKVQFSSLPMSTLYVDDRKIGPSIPARTVELSEGRHTVRFEHPDFPPYQREFRVGADGAPPVVYRFPIGYLVIEAPAWTGANVLIDSKFKGVLTGQKSFPLKPGLHRVTLSREGFAPLTADVTVPEGDKQTWTPPAPTVRPEGS